MSPETKKLIQSKLHRYLPGEHTHALDEEGCWIHVRDIKSIIQQEAKCLAERMIKENDLEFFGDPQKFPS